MELPFRWRGLTGPEAVKAHRDETLKDIREQKAAKKKRLNGWRREAAKADTSRLETYLAELEAAPYNYFRYLRILVLRDELKTRLVQL